MKVIIVGGVAGGASAATRLRRLNEQAEIIIFERSGFVSYANCGLPYFVGDVMTDPEELTLQSPESLFRRFRINVWIIKNCPRSKWSEGYLYTILIPRGRVLTPSLSGFW